MAQAILLQDVESLGESGTVVEVSPGYLRNYLMPRKLAEPATGASIKAAEKRRQDAERAEREAEERSREHAAVLGRTVLTIPQQAGDDGRLFGSVTTQDIADAILAGASGARPTTERAEWVRFLPSRAEWAHFPLPTGRVGALSSCRRVEWAHFPPNARLGAFSPRIWGVLVPTRLSGPRDRPV